LSHIIFRPSLKEQKLRIIDNNHWKTAPELDSEGLKKVTEIEYPGIFKDSHGKLHDMRPMESCPSLSNFRKMVSKFPLYLQKREGLLSLLETALENQIKELESGNQLYDKLYVDNNMNNLKQKFTRVKNQIAKINPSSSLS
jgi:hypothetical protein